jgi:FG-GAP-like repeat
MATGVFTWAMLLSSGLTLASIANASDVAMASAHIEMRPVSEAASVIEHSFPAPESALCIGSTCANAPVTRASAALPRSVAVRPSAASCTNSSGQVAAVPYDIDGNCTSDLFWMNDETHQFGWWLLEPVPYPRGEITRNISQIVSVTPGYWIAATGDFNNDGKADLVWTSSSRDLYLWTSNGSGFTSNYIGNYPSGWTLVGAADIDGDGYDDLIWENQSACQFGYWLMKGGQVVNRTTIAVTCGYHINFIETAYDSANGTTPAIYWEGASETDLAPVYQWLPQSQTLNASFYASFPSAWTFVAGLRQPQGFEGGINSELLMFSAPTTDATSTLFWSLNLAVAGAHGYEELMPGYRLVAAGHFTGDNLGEASGNQEILWANAAGSLVVWPLDTSTPDVLVKNLTNVTGYSLPNFPAGAGWHVVRPGVQN